MRRAVRFHFFQRDSRWIGLIGRIEGIYRRHIALPPFGANRTFSAKSCTISHRPELCVGKTPMIRSHSNSHDAVIRVYDTVGNVIETHEHKDDFKEW